MLVSRKHYVGKCLNHKNEERSSICTELAIRKPFDAIKTPNLGSINVHSGCGRTKAKTTPELDITRINLPKILFGELEYNLQSSENGSVAHQQKVCIQKQIRRKS